MGGVSRPPAEFDAVFRELRKILEPYGRRMRVTADTPTRYSIDTPVTGPSGKPIFFGAAIIGKSYVSFHLIPIYVYPDLLKGLSSELKKRMQGKSCLNFRSIDGEMLAELKALTAAGATRFKEFRIAGLAAGR
jgi:hypothetical protein